MINHTLSTWDLEQWLMTVRSQLEEIRKNRRENGTGDVWNETEDALAETAYEQLYLSINTVLQLIKGDESFRMNQEIEQLKKERDALKKVVEAPQTVAETLAGEKLSS